MMGKTPHHGKEQALWVYCARKKIFFTFGANISFSHTCKCFLSINTNYKFNEINNLQLRSFFTKVFSKKPALNSRNCIVILGHNLDISQKKTKKSAVLTLLPFIHSSVISLL